MKFPKSIHAEGWLDHFEAKRPGRLPDALQASARAPDVEPVAAAPAGRASGLPWLIGLGGGAVLVAVGVTMSRSPLTEQALPPTLATGQVQAPVDTPVAAAPEAPAPEAPAPVMPQAEPAVAAATPAQPAPPPVVAQAAPKEAAAPKVLQPRPEQLAQAAAPVLLPEPVAPAPAVVPAPLPPEVVAAAPAEPPAVTDTSISAQVTLALATDPVLATVPIAVQTANGIVKLEGQAPNLQAREHATTVAAATSGVKGVDNRLTLPPVAQLQLEPRAPASGG